MPAADAAPTEYEFHPVANKYPLMDKTQLNELAEDIKEYGQRFPGWTFEGKLLVGRNRQRACKIAGVEFWAKPLPEGTDPEAFALSENLHRLQYAEAMRREIMAERRRQISIDRVNGKTFAKIAADRGISVAQVRRDLRDAVMPPPGITDAENEARPGGAPEAEKSGPAKPKGGKVTGEDGKEYPAEKPRKSKKQKAVDAAVAKAVGDKAPDPTEDRGDAWEPPAEQAPAEKAKAQCRGLQDLVRRLDAVAAELEALGRAEYGARLHWQSAQAQIRSARNTIYAGKPTHPCPYCAAEKKPGDCRACDRRRFVTRSSFNAAPPEKRAAVGAAALVGPEGGDE